MRYQHLRSVRDVRDESEAPQPLRAAVLLVWSLWAGPVKPSAFAPSQGMPVRAGRQPHGQPHVSAAPVVCGRTVCSPAGSSRSVVAWLIPVGRPLPLLGVADVVVAVAVIVAKTASAVTVVLSMTLRGRVSICDSMVRSGAIARDHGPRMTMQ